MSHALSAPATTRVHASAVLFTTNLASMARFYERVAGLRLASAADDHVVLTNDGFQLIVHQIPQAYAERVVISTPPEVRLDGAIKLSLPVESLGAARTAAAELGGGVFGVDHEWQYESNTACDGWDPDGNVFQLVERGGREQEAGG